MLVYRHLCLQATASYSPDSSASGIGFVRNDRELFCLRVAIDNCLATPERSRHSTGNDSVSSNSAHRGILVVAAYRAAITLFLFEHP